MKILALDQSMTATGWAFYRPGLERPIYGLRECESWHNCEADQLISWQGFLDNLIERSQPDLLVLERPFTPKGHEETLTNRLAVYGMISLALIAARRSNTKVLLVTPAQWREKFVWAVPAKELKGQKRRTALKRLSVSAARRDGFDVKDHNVAEAIGLLYFACLKYRINWQQGQGPLK